eukprot:m.230445 g.230445  ORF g.230445 m.230445 type:complete len:781 (-) comp12066_c0_seq1:232-2574(-)
MDKEFAATYFGSLPVDPAWTPEQKIEAAKKVIKQGKNGVKATLVVGAEVKLSNKSSGDIIQRCPLRELRTDEAKGKYFVYTTASPNGSPYTHMLAVKKGEDITKHIQSIMAGSASAGQDGTMSRSTSAGTLDGSKPPSRSMSSSSGLSGQVIPSGSQRRLSSMQLSTMQSQSGSAVSVQSNSGGEAGGWSQKFDGLFLGLFPVSSPDLKGFEEGIALLDVERKKKPSKGKAQIGEPGFLVVSSKGVRFEERGSGDSMYQDFIKSIKYTAAMPSSESKFDVFGYIVSDQRLGRVVAMMFHIDSGKGQDICKAIQAAFDANAKEEREAQKVNPFAVVDPTREAAPKALFQKQIHRAHLTAVECIGAGQFGSVYIAHQAVQMGRGDNGGAIRTRAVKLLKNGASPADKKLFIHEAEVTLELQHPNVVRLIGVAIQQKPWLVVLEYMHFGDLRSALKSCKEKGIDVHTGEYLFFAQQLSSGCGFIASKGFVHMDLACRNALLTRNNIVKVADFGLAMRFPPGKNNIVLTENLKLPVRWVAVEGFTSKCFSEKSDVWSFGVTFWEMFTGGDLPYSQLRTNEVPRKVYEGERLERPANCPEDIYEVMRTTWIKSRDERPTFYDLRDKLSQFMEKYIPPEIRDLGYVARMAKRRTKEEIAAAAAAAASGPALPQSPPITVPDYCPVCNAPLLQGMSKASAIVHLRICEANRGEGIIAQGDDSAPAPKDEPKSPDASVPSSPRRLSSINADSGNKSAEEAPAAVPEVLKATHDDGDDLKVDEDMFEME